MQRRLAADGIARDRPARARSTSARWRGATARWARASPTWPAARTTRAGRARARGRARSRPKPLSPMTRAATDALAHTLWPLCERVSARLKTAGLAAGTVTLKLKTSDFRIRTRSRRLADPTQLADTLFRTARQLLGAEADGSTRFRLIGVGADGLVDRRGRRSADLVRSRDGPPAPAGAGDGHPQRAAGQRHDSARPRASGVLREVSRRPPLRGDRSNPAHSIVIIARRGGSA